MKGRIMAAVSHKKAQKAGTEAEPGAFVTGCTVSADRRLDKSFRAKIAFGYEERQSGILPN